MRGAAETTSPVPAGRAPGSPTPGPASEPRSPVTLLTLDKTAYHTRIHLDGDVVYLLTPDAVFRLVEGEPAQSRMLELGDIGVATPSAFVFWSREALWLAPKQGGGPGRLVDLKRKPQLIFAVDDRVAWVERDDQERDTIYRLRGGSPQKLYASRGKVDAATMVEDQVVFVEQTGEAGWRLGAVSTGRGRRAFTRPRKGRAPAMLVSTDEVYFYDGSVSEVRAVSPDLLSERVMARDVVCSPIALADRIFCGRVEELFELPLEGGTPKLVLPNASVRMTAIAADRKRIVWVGDVSRGKLEVKSLTRRDSSAR